MRSSTLRFLVLPAITISVWTLLLSDAAIAGEPCNCDATPCVGDDEGPDWIFLPSLYTHDPGTGRRVTQYQPIPPVYLPFDPTYQESGFHYTQQILRGPHGSVDALHMVQSWGEGYQIRPYGEWEYPYRAGATPYGPWGNPQGPWTLPFDSWQNPFAVGRLPWWPIFPTPLPGSSGSNYAPNPSSGYGTGFGASQGMGNGPGYGTLPMPGSALPPVPAP
jgi:hypothetical protein